LWRDSPQNFSENPAEQPSQCNKDEQDPGRFPHQLFSAGEYLDNPG